MPREAKTTYHVGAMADVPLVGGAKGVVRPVDEARGRLVLARGSIVERVLDSPRRA